MQFDFGFAVTPQVSTERERDGWSFRIFEREVVLLQKPITSTSGGWQSAMREAATRIHRERNGDWTWKVSDQLMQRLYRMCTKQGKHGGYQGRLPMRVLGPVFAAHQDRWNGTWFYGRQEVGDELRIKLGKSDGPSKRLRKYSTDNPRELREVFRIWDPSGKFETAIKKRFHKYRIRGFRGEWFQMVPEVQAFVEMCRRVKDTTELPSWQ